MHSKILVQNEDESFTYDDYWFVEEEIIGFYRTKDNYKDDTVTVHFMGFVAEIKVTDELTRYLLIRFKVKTV